MLARWEEVSVDKIKPDERDELEDLPREDEDFEE